MDTPEGRILSIDRSASPPRATVEVLTAIECARCAAGKGCGAALLGSGQRRRRISVLLGDNPELGVGDRVAVELAPENVLHAAVLVYGWPLGGAIAGAAAAYVYGAGDAGAALFALAGMAAGAALGRARVRRSECLRRFTPVVTARLRDTR